MARMVITGVDGNGRSCVAHEAAIGTPGAALTSVEVCGTTEVPPGPAAPGAGMLLDVEVAPGHTKWLIIQWPPGAGFQMHHTDTIDHDIVLAGSIDLILDDGVHHLEAGDITVINGVDHDWLAGPDGCTLSVTMIGTTPRA